MRELIPHAKRPYSEGHPPMQAIIFDNSQLPRNHRLEMANPEGRNLLKSTLQAAFHAFQSFKETTVQQK